MSRTAPAVWLAFALAILFAFAGVAPAQTRFPDITATYARVDTLDLRIDLHFPPPVPGPGGDFVADSAPRPVILWIHGGGWRGGHRGEENPALALLDSGYVVASIDYRLSQQALWPAQLHDAKAAVRWLRAHAADLRIDTARVVAWGTSAGGHLAAMLGVTGPADKFEGTVGDHPGVSSAVRAVVDYYGPSDFLEPVPRRWWPWSSVGQLLGCYVPKCADRAWLASPVAYTTRNDPPFFITHGTADSTVPFSQSATLDSTLRAAGVMTELAAVPGADHGGPAFVSAEMMGRVAGFLNRVFAGEFLRIPPVPPGRARPEGFEPQTVAPEPAPASTEAPIPSR